MVKIPAKTLFLCVCAFEAIWLLAAQSLGSMILLFPCLVCFLALAAWAALQNIAIPVLMFFLPFATLLKLSPYSVSFYTLALILVYAICMLKGIRNVQVTHLVPALLIIILTLVVKLVEGYPVDNSYVLFSATLLLLPFWSTEMDSHYDFYWLVSFFTMGIVLAALTSQFLMDISSIARYITVDVESGISRYSGYYGDPNYYSAHITAALSGVLVLLLRGMERTRHILLFCMAILLLYCGLLSISKSFLVVTICLILCWLLMLLFQKGRLSAKLLMVITLIVIVMFILSSTVFTDLLDLMVARVERSSNLSELTTHRVDLWVGYLREFRRRPLLLLFGNGFSKNLFAGYAAHNTLLQCVYQLGLTGCCAMVAWFVCFCKNMLAGANWKQRNLTQIAILLLGALGPWMGLDYLLLDEFFIIPVYLCTAILFMDETVSTELSTE